MIMFLDKRCCGLLDSWFPFEEIEKRHWYYRKRVDSSGPYHLNAGFRKPLTPGISNLNLALIWALLEGVRTLYLGKLG